MDEKTEQELSNRYKSPMGPLVGGLLYRIFLGFHVFRVFHVILARVEPPYLFRL